MRTLSIPVYNFEELDDRAKETARNWWRGSGLDYEWWDAIYEDAKMRGALLGIEIDRIYFSGFCSQGDGACFNGRYEYKAGWRKALRAEVGGDDLPELEAIGDALQDVQRHAFYKLSASTRQSGHYMHSGCMDVTVDASDAPNIRENLWADEGDNFVYCEDGIRDTLRLFADWIYEKLEKEYEYLMSDEAVDELIIANEYEFDDNGNVV